MGICTAPVSDVSRARDALILSAGLGANWKYRGFRPHTWPFLDRDIATRPILRGVFSFGDPLQIAEVSGGGGGPYPKIRIANLRDVEDTALKIAHDVHPRARIPLYAGAIL